MRRQQTIGVRARAVAGTLLLAAALFASPAHAETTCRVDGTRMNIVLDTDQDVAHIKRDGAAILVNDRGCDGATVTSIDRIAVEDASGNGGTYLTIDLSGGPFEPGATPEATGISEIEFTHSPGQGELDYDSLNVIGGTGPESITLGSDGVGLNADDDVDLEILDHLQILSLRVESFEGDDVLTAAGGAGTGSPYPVGVALFGGDGADTITGGDGGDRLQGGPGIDVMDGGPDYGGYVAWDVADFSEREQAVTVDLAAGTSSDGDSLTGFDSVFSTIFDDSISGDDGPNLFTDGGGDDTFEGRGGDDYIEGGVGADVMDGGSGYDELAYQTSPAGVELDLAAGTASGGDAEGDSLISIEGAGGSPNDDVLRGTDDYNELEGGEGNDVLEAFDGDDLLYGGPGDDHEIGGPGNDYFSQNSRANGSDILDGGEGDDFVDYQGREVTVRMSANDIADDGERGEQDNLLNIEGFGACNSNDVIKGTSNDDRMLGRGGNDKLSGAAGGDRLVGGEGKDTVAGGGGDDRLRGGGGGDVLNGGPGRDVCVVDKGDETRACERVVTRRHR